MEPIRQIPHIAFLFMIFGFLMAPPLKAQSLTPSRQLDTLLQYYAYRAFGNHPHTGTIYNAAPPSNLTGIKIAVLRLRSGSLRTRGVESYKEFQIPTGIIVQPYVERLAFVYHNLGNWSSSYYPLPGYTHLTPVLGLLAYDAADLSATNLNELDIVASNLPLSLKFSDVKSVPDGYTAKCVWFDLDGLPEFRDLVSADSCSTFRQGHFSIVVNSTGLAPARAPEPAKRATSHKEVWKIVAAVVGGFIGLVLLAMIVVCLCRYGKKKKMAEMERRSEVGESLQMARVGTAQAPVASGTRTQPVLENEYVA